MRGLEDEETKRRDRKTEGKMVEGKGGRKRIHDKQEGKGRDVSRKMRWIRGQGEEGKTHKRIGR